MVNNVTMPKFIQKKNNTPNLQMGREIAIIHVRIFPLRLTSYTETCSPGPNNTLKMPLYFILLHEIGV